MAEMAVFAEHGNLDFVMRSIAECRANAPESEITVRASPEFYSGHTSLFDLSQLQMIPGRAIARDILGAHWWFVDPGMKPYAVSITNVRNP